MKTAQMSMTSFLDGLRAGITKREKRLAKLMTAKRRPIDTITQLRAEIAVAKGRLAHARPDDGASVIVASA